MLDPRLYRAVFAPVVLALIVVAFSLRERPPGLSATLAPDAFDGTRALQVLDGLAGRFPVRHAGTPADRALAARIAAALRTSGFTVASVRRDGPSGPVDTVVATRAGFTNRRVVVLARRDAVGSPAAAQLSGTAALLELGHALGGRTLKRTVVLISTSGGLGEAAAAARAGGPVDGALVLGDLAGSRTRPPFVVPWSDGEGIAPVRLRRTVDAAVRSDVAPAPTDPSPAAQFARLALPLTVGAQGELVADGLPAVLVQASGERGPGPRDPVSAARLQGFGRAVLRSLSALDGGPPLRQSPAAYLVVARKVVPGWAVRLLVGVLLLPVLLAAVDGFARVRRRRQPVGMWLRWVLAGALPFALSALLLVGLGATGLVPAAAIGLGTAGVTGGTAAQSAAALAAAQLTIALGWVVVRPRILRLSGVRGDPASPGAAAALMLVVCALAVAAWIVNPFAAALLVAPLHLWLVVVAPELRMRRRLAAGLALAALIPIALIAVYYARAFGLGPLSFARMLLVLVSRGGVGPAGLVAGVVLLGCLASVLAIARRGAGFRAVQGAGVPVRGPVGYAGPGSLGGTESALRR